MKDLPSMLKYGDRARLFPVLADTSRENRMASIFLSILPVIPALAEEVLSTAGVRIGKRSKIECFTEVVLAVNSDLKNRPDGLIVVTNGKESWTALVEAKIGKAELDPDQIARYLEAAKINKIDAIITISNQFVARADQSPVSLPKVLLRKAKLFHWSWTWIATTCEIISLQKTVDDSEQAFLLSEFIRLMKNEGAGVERFTQMPASWKDVVQSVTNREQLKKSNPEVEGAVAAWFSELQDLSLQISRHIGKNATLRIERKHQSDALERLKDGVSTLADENLLKATILIPDSAADIDVTADLMRKIITVGMRVKAPQDRKSTKARLSWILRMLKSDDPRLILEAHWPGRRPSNQKALSILRETPEAIDIEASDAAPHSFEVLLVEGLGKRFAGRRTFIEDLERIVPKFYDLVGQHLRAWQAPPPKPVKTTPESLDADENDATEDIPAN